MNNRKVKRAIELRDRLVKYHVIGVNPSYLNGHVCVAADIIEERITSLSKYKEECRNWGISMYEVTAEKYFNELNNI